MNYLRRTAAAEMKKHGAFVGIRRLISPTASERKEVVGCKEADLRLGFVPAVWSLTQQTAAYLRSV